MAMATKACIGLGSTSLAARPRTAGTARTGIPVGVAGAIVTASDLSAPGSGGIETFFNLTWTNSMSKSCYGF